KRGQNVRLAARLTGWDIDILTPEEFSKGLEIMSQTLLQVEGITEEHVDRLAALGMISVFDIEEVGADLLVGELEIPEEIAEQAITLVAARAKEVAEQQQREKEEAERRKQEEEEAGRRLLEGGVIEGDFSPDAAAAAILGAGSAPAPMESAQVAPAEGAAEDRQDQEPRRSVSEEDEARAADILGSDGSES